MTCVVCRAGEVNQGKASLTIERGDMTLVLKAIPARVCEKCGEAYFDEATTRRIEAIADQLERAGIRVAVQEYAAA